MANKQSYTSLWYHITWATKCRQPLILPSFEKSLFSFIRTVCKEHSYYLDHINGIEDHIHLLIELRPDQNVSDFVRVVKSKSWYWARKQLGEHKLYWQDGFGAFSVSPQHLDRVRGYIRKQKTHHQQKTQQQEWDGMLEKAKTTTSP